MRSRNCALSGLIVSVLVVASLAFPVSAGAIILNKFIIFSEFGREVNLTQVNNKAGAALEDVCMIESGDICQPGKISSDAGGFLNPEGVAVGPAPDHVVYVTDTGNGRVQVFSSSGTFMSMFGWEVNETKSNQAGSSQEEKDICTAASGNTCRAARTPTQNGVAGEIANPMAITVDQADGSVFVWDGPEHRVEKYSATGTFELVIGGNVNKAKTLANAPEAERNLCVAAEECQAGVESSQGTNSHGSFRSPNSFGNILAVGGASTSKPSLYVGDEGKVQEFETNGKWTGELSLSAISPSHKVQALAVDEAGDLFLAYGSGLFNGAENTPIREYGPDNVLVREIVTGAEVVAMAIDQNDRLAVVAFHGGSEYRRVLYDGKSGKELNELGSSGRQAAGDGLAFSLSDELYVAQGGSFNQQDVQILVPVQVAELTTGACRSPTATGFTATGEVNPKNVEETMAWFEYGRTEQLGLRTAIEPVETGNVPVAFEAPINELRPNEAYYYRLAGEDANFHPLPTELPLVGEIDFCETPYLPPVVEGPPSDNVGAFSANMFDKVNPENARTKYGFEYARCESAKQEIGECSATQRTATLESSQFGLVGVMQTVGSLQPNSIYRYRLYAESENRTQSKSSQVHGEEGVLETLAAPRPSASTEPPLEVTSSSAVLAGSVNSGGAQAAWSFQVGVYNPAGTVFSTVVWGATGSEPGPEGKSFALSGLQSDTTYAYRIVVYSAYAPGGQMTGATITFTTSGPSTTLQASGPLEMLPAPPLVFPSEPQAVAKKLTKVQKLSIALKACRKKRKKLRAHCEREARSRYAERSKLSKSRKG
jgi:hypothetical protein